MGEPKCPFCGSYNASRTASGWGESIAKNTATFVFGTGIALLTHAFLGEYAGHAVGHQIKEVGESLSSEYKCNRCGRTFRYSSKNGSKIK